MFPPPYILCLRLTLNQEHCMATHTNKMLKLSIGVGMKQSTCLTTDVTNLQQFQEGISC